MKHIGAAIVLLLAFGCTAQQINQIDPPVKEPPCDANNPYKCDDGSCCDSGRPVCMGPDDVGFYCEAQQFDPDDPTHIFGAEPRHRSRPREQ